MPDEYLLPRTLILSIPQSVFSNFDPMKEDTVVEVGNIPL